MDAAIVHEFQMVLDKHFDFSAQKLSESDYKHDWNAVISKYQSKIGRDDIAFLARVREEIEDILVHMPGKGLSGNGIDWNKWKSGDDFLRFKLSKAILQYHANAALFETILGNAHQVGQFQRPYSTNVNLDSEIASYIEKSIQSHRI